MNSHRPITIAAVEILRESMKLMTGDPHDLPGAIKKFVAADDDEVRLALAAQQPPVGPAQIVEHPVAGPIVVAGGGPLSFGGTDYVSAHHLVVGVALALLNNECSAPDAMMILRDAEARVLLEGAAITVDPRPATVGDGAMTWPEAQRLAEAHVRAHHGAFSSVKRLAEIVGCSRPTLDKAIKGSTYLTARKAEKVQSPRMQRLDDRAVEQTGTAQYEQSKREEHADWHKEDLDRLIAEQAADLARDERQAKASSKGRS